MFWLGLGYPLLAHLAVLTHDRRLEWLALVWLLGIALSGALIQRRLWAWSALLAGTGLVYLLVMKGKGLYALYIPPVAIPAALLMLFALSLRPGEIPLVTRIARLLHDGPFADDLVVYTRHVTQLWCGICAALLLSAVLLTLLAPIELWSLMTNVIHYVVLGAVFVLEYGYRRWRFSHHEHSGLFQYLRRLTRTKLKV
jgi:uncharacterized membrane protein